MSWVHLYSELKSHSLWNWAYLHKAHSSTYLTFYVLSYKSYKSYNCIWFTHCYGYTSSKSFIDKLSILRLNLKRCPHVVKNQVHIKVVFFSWLVTNMDVCNYRFYIDSSKQITSIQHPAFQLMIIYINIFDCLSKIQRM